MGWRMPIAPSANGWREDLVRYERMRHAQRLLRAPSRWLADGQCGVGPLLSYRSPAPASAPQAHGVHCDRMACQNARWRTTRTNWHPTGSTVFCSATSMPFALDAQLDAAVVSLLMLNPSFLMTPAPRKPTPVTMPCRHCHRSAYLPPDRGTGVDSPAA